MKDLEHPLHHPVFAEALLAVFLLATLNRETTFLLTIFCAVWLWGKLSWAKYLGFLVAQVFIFAAVRLGLDAVLVDTGEAAVFNLHENLVAYRHLLPLFPFIVLLAFVRLDTNIVGMFLLIVFPLQVILHLLFGMPFEFRVFAESVPLLLLAYFPKLSSGVNFGPAKIRR